MNFIDLSNIFISAHALKRFRERWRYAQKPENWEKTLRRLLSATEEIKKKPIAYLKALIRYQEPAKYFYKSGWVFVTNEEIASLLTVERREDHPDMWEKPKKPKKRRR